MSLWVGVCLLTLSGLNYRFFFGNARFQNALLFKSHLQNTRRRGNLTHLFLLSWGNKFDFAATLWEKFLNLQERMTFWKGGVLLRAIRGAIFLLMLCICYTLSLCQLLFTILLTHLRYVRTCVCVCVRSVWHTHLHSKIVFRTSELAMFPNV